MFTHVSGSLSQKFSGFFSKLKRQISTSTRFTTTSTLNSLNCRHSHSSQTVTSACGKTKIESNGSIHNGGSSSAVSHNIQLPSGLPLRTSKLSSSTSAHRLPHKFTAATRGFATCLSSKSSLSDLQSTAVVSTIQTRGYAAQKIEHYKCKRGSNIILMGAPGAGKTVVARELGALLKMKVIDVDDHVLEPSWGMSVAEKLAHVGGKEMLDLEAQTFMKFKAERSIISLSGSQPMNDDSMDYARKLGTIVYLDVEKQDILDRLNVMKVNRIVGQEKGIGMDTILSYRQQFYERNYDIRVICPRNESVEATAKRITKLLKRWGPKKGFRSTRSNSKFDTFLDVTVQGLAPDRGLYVSSTEIPHMSIGQWERLVDKPYTDCALKILEQWIPPSEVNHKELRTLIDLAYTHENFSHKDIAPIVPLENNQYLLELFHGPTASFKDIPMQLTARLFDYAVKRMKTGVRSLILVATSGDTGGAVMNAFSRHTDNSDVVVLFPEDGVSSIQKAQLTSFDGPRAISIGVKGDFDYCQTAIKDIFMDHKYEEKMRIGLGYGISAANSINFARLLPQVVYHAWSYLVMVRDGHIKLGDKIDICVPTGNFGNILGAYYAKQMGIPIRNMTIASNSNNVLSEFFKTGEYDIGYRTLMTTLSPAIDILRSSNLERYLYTASGNDYSLMAHLFKTLEETGKFAIKKDSELFRKMQRDFSADWCTDEESKDTIKEVFKRTGYLIDPHTAVAKTVADRHSLGADVPLVISATAHYSKFADGILKSLGLQSETYTNNPVELINKALKLTENPSKHKNLLKDVSNVRPHKVIQNPNQETIRDHIETFINDYYDERRATKKP